MGGELSSWQMFFLGGGKCPNLGVVNVRILGVVNVCLANNLTPSQKQYFSFPRAFSKSLYNMSNFYIAQAAIGESESPL